MQLPAPKSLSFQFPWSAGGTTGVLTDANVLCLCCPVVWTLTRNCVYCCSMTTGSCKQGNDRAGVRDQLTASLTIPWYFKHFPENTHWCCLSDCTPSSSDTYQARCRECHQLMPECSAKPLVLDLVLQHMGAGSGVVAVLLHWPLFAKTGLYLPGEGCGREWRAARALLGLLYTLPKIGGLGLSKSQTALFTQCWSLVSSQLVREVPSRLLLLDTGVYALYITAIVHLSRS